MCLIAKAKARAGALGQARLLVSLPTRPGQWPGLGFSGEILCRGSVASADKSAFPPRTCLPLDPVFLSPPLPSLSLTSRLLSSYVPVSRFCFCNLWCSCYYIIVSCANCPVCQGAPCHLCISPTLPLVIFLSSTLLSPIHQSNRVLYRITNIDSVTELTVSLISSRTFRSIKSTWSLSNQFFWRLRLPLPR